MNVELAEKQEKLKAVERLMESPDFKTVFLPHLVEMAKHHAGECRNKNLTPDKRAEHIEAAELAENLQKFLKERQAQLKATILKLGRGK
jgi:hypothetical protein